jgi:hypothetical protein
MTELIATLESSCLASLPTSLCTLVKTTILTIKQTSCQLYLASNRKNMSTADSQVCRFKVAHGFPGQTLVEEPRYFISADGAYHALVLSKRGNNDEYIGDAMILQKPISTPVNELWAEAKQKIRLMNPTRSEA